MHIRQWMTDDEIAAVSRRYVTERENVVSSRAERSGRSPGPKSVRGGWAFLQWLAVGLETIPTDQLSSGRDFSGAEALVIGPDVGGEQVTDLIAAYPGLRAVHIMDANADHLRTIGTKIEDALRARGLPVPVIDGYRINLLELPAELRGRIDLVFDSNVFDRRYFTPTQLRQASEQIVAVLKTGGTHLSGGMPLEAYLPTDPMTRVSLPGVRDIVIRIKSNPPDRPH